MIKGTLGSLSLDNISKDIKDELAKRNNEDKVAYLNSLSLDKKITFFNGMETYSLFNSLSRDNNQIKDIVFSMDGNDLQADVLFNDSNVVLDAKTNTKLSNFDYNLKVDLGIIDPNAKSKTIWLAVGLSIGLGLAGAIIAFFIIRRQRNKARYYGSSNQVEVVTSINENDVEQAQEIINNSSDNSDSKDIN